MKMKETLLKIQELFEKDMYRQPMKFEIKGIIERLDKTQDVQIAVSDYIKSKDMYKFDTLKIDSVEVDLNGSSDLTDAYITYAEYDGEVMSEDQLEVLNQHYGDFVYEHAMRNLEILADSFYERSKYKDD